MEELAFLMAIVLVIWNFVQGSHIRALQDRLRDKASTSHKDEYRKALDTNDFEEEPLGSVMKKHTSDKKVKEAVVYEPKEPFAWEEFFTKKFFAILGALSVVLAIGFFAVWSFAHGLIGPAGRIALGIIVSLVLLVLGEFSREKYPKYFAYLTAAGIAGLIITTFVARNVYGFLDPLQAFTAYVFEVLVGVYLALRYNSRVIGNFAIVAGLIAPMLVKGDSSEIGLLAYLAVLTVGGFVISLKQKWPEILIVLFLGILSYEWLIINATKYNFVTEAGSTKAVRTGFVMDQPILFLAFVFGMHWLLGLGGIIRAVQEKLTQSWKKEVEGTTVIEMVLMVVSIIAANGVAAEIFRYHGWSYLGFFLLVQGFILFFLSQWLKKSDLPFFERIALSGTLITVILATIMEIGPDNETWLTMALLLEGVLMVWAAGELKDKWIGLFGRIALLLGSLFGLGLSIWWAGLGLLIYGFGNVVAFMKAEKDWEKILSTIGMVWFVILFLGWNFGRLDGLINRNSIEIVWLFVLPTILSAAVSYSIVKTRHVFSIILGICTMICSSLFAWEVIDRLSYKPYGVAAGLAILLFSLIGYFAILSSAFLEDKGTYLVKGTTRKTITKVVLTITTLMVLFVGAEIFKDPVTTVFWIVWGILLLVLGTHNSWPTFRYFGIGTLLLVIGKLYLIDVWGWNMGEKVIAFSILGVALLGLSFYSQKKK